MTKSRISAPPPVVTISSKETEASSDVSVSFFSVFKKISSLGIPMGFSFTFSFEVYLSVLFLQLLSETEDDKAAATLVSTYMNTICVLAMAPLFALAINLSKKLGAWRENQDTQDTVNDDALSINSERETNEDDLEISQERSRTLSNASSVIHSGIYANSISGLRSKEQIEIVNIHGLLIATAVSIPTFFALFYSKPILITIFQQEESVVLSAEKFLKPYAFAIPGLMARMSLEQTMFSFGKTMPAMWIGLASLSVGTSLALLLAFGFKIGSLQLPEMKQAGIAIGFITESYITAISYGLFVKFNKECKEFDFYTFTRNRFKRNIDELKDILKLGGAITFTVATDLALTLAIGIFSGLLGVEAQAAMSYCMQFIYFEFIMLAAFSMSCAQEISRALGAKKIMLARKTAEYGLLTTLIYLSPIPIFFAAYPEALEYISGGSTEAISEILTTLVPIMCAGLILDVVRYNVLQQSRALQDLFVPNTIAFLGMSTAIALSGTLGLLTQLEIEGVATGYSVGLGVTALALSVRWWNEIKKLQLQIEPAQGKLLSGNTHTNYGTGEEAGRPPQLDQRKPA